MTWRCRTFLCRWFLKTLVLLYAVSVSTSKRKNRAGENEVLNYPSPSRIILHYPLFSITVMIHARHALGHTCTEKNKPIACHVFEPRFWIEDVEPSIVILRDTCGRATGMTFVGFLEGLV